MCRLRQAKGRALTALPHQLLAAKEGPGELESLFGVEGFAGVDVHAKEQKGLFPGVEVSAGGFPVNPAGPTKAIGAVGDGL